jgi:hypothetical protein
MDTKLDGKTVKLLKRLLSAITNFYSENALEKKTEFK